MTRLSSIEFLRLLALCAIAALLVFVIPVIYLHAATRIIVFGAAAMSLNFLVGNVGLISMGHGLFLGLGAYVIAVGNVKFHLPLVTCTLLAVAISTVVAAVAGFIALRARALFFALLTLALGQIFYVFVARTYDLTGGDDGLIGIDVPAWLESDAGQYLFALGFTFALCVVLLVVLASPFGATLRAIRDNSERVASLGGNPKLYEFAAFVFSGVATSIVGVVVALTNGSVEPSIASWTTGATLLVMVALGGRSTFLGPLVGVLLVEAVRTFSQTVSTHADSVIGVMVILCSMFFPEGVGRALKLTLPLRRRRPARADRPSATSLEERARP